MHQVVDAAVFVDLLILTPVHVSTFGATDVRVGLELVHDFLVAGALDVVLLPAPRLALLTQCQDVRPSVL